MDKDTIEFCWGILEQYIKTGDKQSAVDHLVADLVDSDINDDDLEMLSTVDVYFKNAINEYAADYDTDEDFEWE